MGPRLFSSSLDRRHRTIYRGVVGFFVVVLLAVVWPVAKLFSRVEPMLLGLPWFLFYLTVLLVGSFVVLLCLFLWEGRTGASSDPDPDASAEIRP